jgi:hypothetical protein
MVLIIAAKPTFDLVAETESSILPTVKREGGGNLHARRNLRVHNPVDAGTKRLEFGEGHDDPGKSFKLEILRERILYAG